MARVSEDDEDDFPFPMPAPNPAMAEMSAEELLAGLQTHPFFMTSLPDNPEDNKYISAIQDLLYGGTPEEVAANFKEQGNEAVRSGMDHFRDAIEFYSKGIAAQPADKELLSTLFSNRAAVNLELQNFRSVLTDCAKALQASPGNVKAFYRAGRAALALEHVEDALDAVERGMKLDPSNQPLINLHASILAKKEQLETQKRERDIRDRERQAQNERLQNAIRASGAVIRPSTRKQSSYDPAANLAVADLPQPHLDDSVDPPAVSFPALLLYPQYRQTDLIQSIPLTDTLSEHLDTVLAQNPPWDDQGAYSSSSVDLWFETPLGHDAARAADPDLDDVSKMRISRLDRNRTLGEVVKLKGFVVWDGVARLVVLPKRSKFTVDFLKKYGERKLT